MEKSRLRLLIEDTEIQVLAAIKSIDSGYGATAVAELNGAKMMIDDLRSEERSLRNSGIIVKLGILRA